MTSADVLVIGGGPAGSSCAWKLRQAGVDVLVLDRAVFPRDKVCAGWITPAVADALDLDVRDYRRSRTFQPITAFRTGLMGGALVDTSYDAPVSFGILRREFDHYLLERSGARLALDVHVNRIEHTAAGWVVNDEYAAPMLVGAGGHFCPVARRLNGPRREEPVVVANEVEFLLSAAQMSVCRIAPEAPELYFCSDLAGYGWCFRKERVLNVGIGRQDRRRLSEHLQRFVAQLQHAGRLPGDLPDGWRGHAYLLYDSSPRTIVADNALLIGDAAGLAYTQSGEGIRPAVESGLLAAQAIAGNRRSDGLAAYQAAVQARFGRRGPTGNHTTSIGGLLPRAAITAAGRRLLGTRWFSRHVVLDRWFLHRNESSLRFTANASRAAAVEAASTMDPM
ncbi:MAG: FAD-dependent oxidoreductase [Luteitalea sp.]|nr:FAD-dependent oxidoreductase [Luteitalea sp.]